MTINKNQYEYHTKYITAFFTNEVEIITFFIIHYFIFVIIYLSNPLIHEVLLIFNVIVLICNSGSV